MFRFTLLFLILIFYNWLPAQINDNEDYTIALAELTDIYQTGKRHNSYFLTFKIKKILQGQSTDSLIITQEISHDFGASQIFRKVSPNGYSSIKNLKGTEDIIIKYAASDLKQNNKRMVDLIWASEKNRWQSFEKLEKLLHSSDFPYFSMLKEKDGKLYVTDNDGKNWLVVESMLGSGNWELVDPMDVKE